jgi:hypothetical protein
MTKKLKMYCREHGYDNPKFWPADYMDDYAVSFHMTGNDQREEFKANVVFLLGKHRKNEAKLLGYILKKLQEPIVMNVPLADSTNVQSIYKSHGLTLMPGRWTDKNEEEYEVYIKGSMKMGGWANMMTRVEGIDCDLISIKRPVPVILFSFITYKLSQVFTK